MIDLILSLAQTLRDGKDYDAEATVSVDTNEASYLLRTGRARLVEKPKAAARRQIKESALPGTSLADTITETTQE